MQGRKLKKHGNRFLKNLSRSSHSVDPVISSWRRMKHRGFNRSVWLICWIVKITCKSIENNYIKGYDYIRRASFPPLFRISEKSE